MAQEQRVFTRDGSTAYDVLLPSLKVGATCGTAGFLFGGTTGILKSTTPFLFATASGIQTFALGTTFWATRTGILSAWQLNPPKTAEGALTAKTPTPDPLTLTSASALAGGLSGGLIALLTRGRANTLPAAFMWALFGGVGQVSYDWYAARQAAVAGREGFWTRMARRAWSPVTVMSDEEYAGILRERLLRVEAEIAVLEDRIEGLKGRGKEERVVGEGGEGGGLP